MTNANQQTMNIDSERCANCGEDYTAHLVTGTMLTCPGITGYWLDPKKVLTHVSPRDPMPRFESGQFSGFPQWHAALASWTIRQLDAIRGKHGFLASVFDCVEYQARKFYANEQCEAKDRLIAELTKENIRLRNA